MEFIKKNLESYLAVLLHMPSLIIVHVQLRVISLCLYAVYIGNEFGFIFNIYLILFFLIYLHGSYVYTLDWVWKAPLWMERYSKALTNKHLWKKYNINYKRKYVKFQSNIINFFAGKYSQDHIYFCFIYICWIHIFVDFVVK